MAVIRTATLSYRSTSVSHSSAGNPGMTDAFRVTVVRPPHDLVLTVREPSGGHQVSWEVFLQSLRRAHAPDRARTDFSPLAGFYSRKFPPARAPHSQPRTPRPLMLAAASFGHYIMQARMLRGSKLRAESFDAGQG